MCSLNQVIDDIGFHSATDNQSMVWQLLAWRMIVATTLIVGPGGVIKSKFHECQISLWKVRSSVSLVCMIGTMAIPCFFGCERVTQNDLGIQSQELFAAYRNETLVVEDILLNGRGHQVGNLEPPKCSGPGARVKAWALNFIPCTYSKAGWMAILLYCC